MKTKKSKSTAVKIAAKPLTEQQIQEFVKHYNKFKSFPGSKIPCNVTGKLTTCVGPWMVKKIKEFGGAENLLRNYKCRGAIKASKQIIKPVSNKKRRIKIKDLKDEQKNWDIPKVSQESSRPISDIELSEASSTTCFRPDVFLDNDRHCDGCEFFDVCTNSMKNLATKKKFRK